MTMIDSFGSSWAGTCIQRPNHSIVPRQGVEHLAIAADEETGLIGVAWNSLRFQGANAGERDIWLYIDKKP